MSIFRLQTSSENGTSPFTSVIEETTQADAPPQLYKPGLKRLWKMEPNEQLDEANQKRPGPFYKAEITWKAPKDTGGLPITEYRLQQRIADRNQSWEMKYGGKNESTVVDNLPPGSRIEFRVQVCPNHMFDVRAPNGSKYRLFLGNLTGGSFGLVASGIGYDKTR